MSNKKMLSNMSLMTGVSIASQGMAFLRFSIFMKLLTLSMFGLLQVVISSIEMVKGILEVRTNEALTRYFIVAKNDNDSGRMWAIVRLGYSIDLVIAVLGFVFFQMAAGSIAGLYGLGGVHAAEGWLKLYSFYFLAGIGGNSMWGVLQAYEKFSYLARLQFYLELGRVLFPVLFYILWGGLESIFMGFIVAIALNNFTGQILTCVFMRKEIPRGESGSALKEFKIMWPFLKQSFFSLCLKSVNRQAIIPMVQILTKNSMMAGIVSIAVKLSSLLNLSTSAVSTVFFPHLTSLWVKEKYTEFRALLLKATRTIFVISLLSAFVIYFSYPLLIWLVGKSGDQNLSGLPGLLMVYLGVNVLLCATSWARPACLAMNRPEYSTIANLMIAVIVLVSAPFLLPAYGLAGMAMTYMLMWLFPQAWYAWRIWMKVGKKIKAAR